MTFEQTVAEYTPNSRLKRYKTLLIAVVLTLIALFYLALYLFGDAELQARFISTSRPAPTPMHTVVANYATNAKTADIPTCPPNANIAIGPIDGPYYCERTPAEYDGWSVAQRTDWNRKFFDRAKRARREQ